MNETVAPDAAVGPVVMLPGTFTTGAVVSTTAMVKLPVAVRPLASAALQLTVVLPKGNVDPEAGVHVTVGDVGFAAVAVAR
jgi:hypothetical protein